MNQKMNYLMLYLRIKAREFVTDERGDVNIVSIVVLIGIALVLAILFKDQIVGLLKALFGKIGDSAAEVNKGVTPFPTISIP